MAVIVTVSPMSVLVGNKAVSLDGNGDYVNIGKPMPGSLKVQNAITLEAWIKPNELPSQIGDGESLGAIVACQWDPTYSGYSILLDGRVATHGGVRGGIHFQRGNRTNYWANDTQGTTSVAVPVGQWSHVAAVAEANGTYKVYINTELVADWVPGSGNISYDNNNRIAIGCSDFNFNPLSRFFNGLIDEVRIWNVARTQNDIKATVNIALNGSEPNLVGYWNFDDGTASDLSPYNNDGTLQDDAVIVDTTRPPIVAKSQIVAKTTPQHQQMFGIL